MAAFTGNGYLAADITALLAIGASDRPAFKVAILVVDLGWYEYDNVASVGGLTPADNPSTGRWFSINAVKIANNNESLIANKSYLLNTQEPSALTLPTATVGDVITVTAGVSSVTVFHGNDSDRILNNSTLSVAGILSGLFLNPYSSISLICIAQYLWVSTFRARIPNNWADPVEEVTATLKAYTPSGLQTYAYYTGQELIYINDGNRTNQGVLKVGGGTSGELQVLLTFSTAIHLTGINYWLGQFNGAYNFPTSLDIYKGDAVTDFPINTTSFSDQNGSISVSSGADYSSTYVLRFYGATEIGILEIEAFGKELIGGEITV